MTPLRLLEGLRHEGAEALRRSVWLLAGTGLGVAAAVFGAGALAIALTEIMPLWAGVLFGAMALAVAASVCVAAGAWRSHVAPQAPAPATIASRVPDLAYQLLAAEIHARPGKTAAAAVAAGLILGALDALERHEEPHPQHGRPPAPEM